MPNFKAKITYTMYVDIIADSKEKAQEQAGHVEWNWENSLGEISIEDAACKGELEDA